MITNGFAGGRSNAITNGVPFSDINGNATTSSYIIVANTGAEGSLVYVNSSGETQYAPYVFFGYNPIGATQILASAVFGETTYTTTATGLSWLGSVRYG